MSTTTPIFIGSEEATKAGHVAELAEARLGRHVTIVEVCDWMSWPFLWPYASAAILASWFVGDIALMGDHAKATQI